ncbi:MAG: CatB-related O-acetyltransferase [Alphaproteobacteria bacterium]|nr:CatB-related O-acetyltransferase [Alphaproteobacteria bacterium]
MKMFKKLVFTPPRMNSDHLKNLTKDIDPTASIDENCEIGEYTFIGKDVDVTKAHIGRYCSIAPHVRIGMGEHDINLISTSAYLYDGNWYDLLTQKEVVIKNDVWIGTETIIRRGCTIGNCAVVAANSFVNKDVPDFAVVAGSPAHIIKYRFTADIRDKILKSEYWNYRPEEAKKIIANII